mgnify:CR=1 FL=1
MRGIKVYVQRARNYVFSTSLPAKRRVLRMSWWVLVSGVMDSEER